jgi:general secretion pathway protein G/type IV pilus assembly protein PilA
VFFDANPWEAVLTLIFIVGKLGSLGLRCPCLFLSLPLWRGRLMMTSYLPINRLFCQTIHHRSNHQTGFTLLELLIVVIITGVLTAIATPNLLGQVDKARYAEAKTQMGCLAKELLANRYEKGGFPPDVARDIRPSGINCFYTQASGKVPFDSKYDYDNSSNSSSCYIQIVFLGKDVQKEVPNNLNGLYPQPGIYEYRDINPSSDDLVYSLGTNPLGVGC